MSNLENPDEDLAREWLVSLARDPATVRRSEHEPPDYVLNGNIAVEVTRITEGDETSLHSLGPVVEDVLKNLGPPGNGQSLCVLWVYEPLRCLPPRKHMKKQIRNALMPYTERWAVPEKLRYLSLAGIEDLLLPCGLSLRLAHPRPTSGAPSFKFYGFSGMTGSHVRQELLKALRHADRKKSEDVRDRGSHVGPWWLVLVDRVFSSEIFTFDGTNEGKGLLRDMTSLTQELACAEGTSWPWSRIVVLAPQVPCHEYVLFDKDGKDGSSG